MPNESGQHELTERLYDLRDRIARGETTFSDVNLFDYIAGISAKKQYPEPDLSQPDPFAPNHND